MTLYPTSCFNLMAIPVSPLFLAGSDDDEEDSEILQQTGNVLSKMSDYLPRGVIDIGRMKDANYSKPLNVSGRIFGCASCVFFILQKR